MRTSPNSSLVWIKYMAFLVQLADVDKARAIAERFESCLYSMILRVIFYKFYRTSMRDTDSSLDHAVTFVGHWKG